jgi:steroid delta-isomerase-like uncharacterized protein
MSTTENKALVRAIYDELVNGKRLAVIRESYAPDYVYHGPSGETVSGLDEYTQIFAGFFEGFPDLQITIGDQVAEDDRVATRWTMRGTHRGDFFGLAPTNRALSFSGQIIARISAGKVSEDWETYDNQHLLQQLGVEATG